MFALLTVEFVSSVTFAVNVVVFGDSESLLYTVVSVTLISSMVWLPYRLMDTLSSDFTIV